MLEKYLQKYRTTFFSRYKYLLAGVFIGLMIGGLFAAERMIKWSSELNSETQANKETTFREEINKVNDTSAELSADLRDRFKTQLREYELELEPIILSDDFWTREPNAKSKLVNTKRDAFSSFGEGDYDTALTYLNQLTNTAKELIQERDTALDQAVKQIEQALEKEDLRAAEKAMDEALTLAPFSPEVLALNDHVERLPLVVKLKEMAQVARIENNPQAELEALQELLEIKPDLQEIKSRITTLQELLKTSRFEEHIRKGVAALDSLKLETARQHLDAARQLDPSRDEVKILLQRILMTAAKLETKRLVGQGDKASAKDDWQKALNYYSKALELSPGSGTLKIRKDKAQHIVTVESHIKKYLQAPSRLSSPNVASQANKLIKEASQIANDSPRLARLVKDLSDLMEEYNEPIDVMIISDNQTFVQVRGVGKVGKVKSKLIQLKPGQYNFEGKCEGYHSVLFPVHITPESNGREVRVTCNEPL